MVRELVRKAEASPATAGRAFLLLFGGFLLLSLASGPVAAGARQSTPVAHQVKASPAAVNASWDQEDLLESRPAEVAARPERSFDLPKFPEASVSGTAGDFLPGDPTAYPQRVHGKVFFLSGGSAFSCSGTLVNSRQKNVIYTAGHCVFDRETGKFVSKLIFVPGYQNGNTPLGTYAATSLVTTTGWIDNGAFSYDIAAVALEDRPEDDLGSRKIAFDLDPGGRSWTIYGYPQEPDPPYTGEQLVGCDAETATRDAGTPPTIGASPCSMEQGASGGGWITDGEYLNSVVSYGYCETEPDRCGLIFGPYFSNAAKALYKDPSIGGSADPGVRLKAKPPRKVRKKKVKFRLAGSGSTPVEFRCKFDRQSYVDCSKKVSVSRLSLGKHVFRARSIDQTDSRSSKTATWKFRVKKK